MAETSFSGQAPLFQWLDHRAAGVLMHPTSLPGDFGVGSLDEAVNRWLDFLKASGIRYWQVCPLGPTGYGDSPYQCFSAFAGNPYLIDVVALERFGLLTQNDLNPLRLLPRERVDYGWLYSTKWPILFKAYTRYKTGSSPALPYGDFAQFKQRNRHWLEPYSLFRALKDHHNGEPWWNWPANMRFFANAKTATLPESVSRQADGHSFLQYIVFGQWQEVRAAARERGVEVIGDTPIFVALDSADIWANPKLFQLDLNSGRPFFVAGVPPDYFSETGQLWGNPLYDWDAHAEEGYAWWIQRLEANFLFCDVLRIDHFRGFDSYWSIPANAKTAKTGAWERGPGLALFEAFKAKLPSARLIAEDLGELTPSVVRLRQATGLPGMAILQFAFGSGADNLYLPHNHISNNLVYPGTHDNDTTLGWYRTAAEGQRDHLRRYLRINGQEVAWDFVRAGYESVCNLAIFPLQDLLKLGAEGRLNTPGKAEGNWQWRFSDAQLEKLQAESASYLKELGYLYGRIEVKKTGGG